MNEVKKIVAALISISMATVRVQQKMKIQKDIGTLLDEVVLVMIGEAGNRGIVGKVVGRLVGGGSV